MKMQRVFNRLVRKIERLRDSLEAEAEAITADLEFFVARIHALRTCGHETRRRVVVPLAPFLRTGLNRRQTTLPREVILKTFNVILARAPLNAKLQTIYVAVTGMSAQGGGARGGNRPGP